MKCALVIPSWRPEDIFPAETAGSQINYWQPLGTLYVAAALECAGHEVHYIDGAFLSHRETVERVVTLCPDVVGLYATTFGWKRASRTAADIRSSLPNTFLMTGGPFPSALPDYCLADCSAMDAAVKWLTAGYPLHQVVFFNAIKMTSVANVTPRRAVRIRLTGSIPSRAPCR